MRPRLLTAILRRAESAGADADLLARFRATRDDAAFAALVRRHARLVWGVCRNLLPAEADAEDAFQATFLALDRAAGTLRNDRAVPGWLHATAVRVCLQSRRAAARRHRHERRASLSEASAPVADSRWADVLAAVHEEVNRLPPPLRTAFVACCLEGRGQTEAAAFLGWKLGTLSGRLTRAKQTILDRLDRRGLVPAVGLAAVSAASDAPARAVSAAIKLIHGSGSTTVLELARRATGGTMATKLWAAAVGGAAITTIGGGMWLSQTVAQSPVSSTPPAATAEPSVPPDPKPGVFQQPFIRFRVEYLTVKRESADQAAFAEQLRKYGRDGWHLDASEMLVPTSGGGPVPHLVFSRQTPDLGVAGYYIMPPGVPPKQRTDLPSPPPVPPPATRVGDDATMKTKTKMVTTELPLKYMDHMDALQLLNPLLMGNGPAGEVYQIGVSSKPNTLFVIATPEQAERVKTLIARLDVPVSHLAVIRLKNVAAAEAATMLREIFFGPKGKAPPTTGTGRIASMVIAADERANAIIVSGSPADIGVVEKLVAAMDHAQPPGTKAVVIPLKHGSAAAVVEHLRRLYATAKEDAFRGAGKAPATSLSLAADERTNSIIVGGTPAQVSDIEKIVAELDKPKPTEKK